MRLLFRGRKKKASASRIFTISDKAGDIQTMSKLVSQTLCEIPSADVVFLCIGSIRSTGDSLGPMVGSMLKERGVPFPVYGTLDDPVHALNLSDVLEKIHRTFDDPTIFPIDASLGDACQVGDIYFMSGPLTPGSAANKSLHPIGCHHIRAVVNELNPLLPARALNEAKVEDISRLARIITEVVVQVKTN